MTDLRAAGCRGRDCGGGEIEAEALYAESRATVCCGLAAFVLARGRLAGRGGEGSSATLGGASRSGAASTSATLCSRAFPFPFSLVPFTVLTLDLRFDLTADTCAGSASSSTGVGSGGGGCLAALFRTLAEVGRSDEATDLRLPASVLGVFDLAEAALDVAARLAGVLLGPASGCSGGAGCCCEVGPARALARIIS